MKIVDVREHMPNYANYCDQFRSEDIHGLVLHHSATAHPRTGLGTLTAAAIFREQVHTRGWDHGAYHYLVHPNGMIEYALDERIRGYHAGFQDPGDSLGLEFGQYWNNHFLAICLVGWFESGREYSSAGSVKVPIPDYFTRPTATQYSGLIDLIRQLQKKYEFSVGQVKGHCELEGSNTVCPGANIDLPALRARLAQT